MKSYYKNLWMEIKKFDSKFMLINRKCLASLIFIAIAFSYLAVANQFADWPLEEGDPTLRWRTQTNGVAKFKKPPGKIWENFDGTPQKIGQPSYSPDYDLNNDGIKDILYINSKALYAINGRDDSVLWTCLGFEGATFGIGDVNGDDVLEIALNNLTEIWLLNAIDGTIYTKIPVSLLAADPIIIDDLDGNNTKEIITRYYITYMESDLTAVKTNYYTYTGQSQNNLFITDLDSDGEKEIVSGCEQRPSTNPSDLYLGFVRDNKGMYYKRLNLLQP